MVVSTVTSSLVATNGKQQTIEAPVLLVVYNRPKQTKLLIDRLREAGVRKIYVSSDAAADQQDVRRVNDVRRLLQCEFDWDCQVSINLRERNRGLRHSMTSAIDWFFENEDEGIILEDDCLPHIDFFEFCSVLLSRFRDNPRVMHIAGDNSAGVSIDHSWSYCFVRYPHIWGWATWRRAWRLYDRNLELWADFKSNGMIPFLFNNPHERRVWEPIYDRLRAKQSPDTWDWQWSATLAMHDGLAAQSLSNLISNTGFGPDATHTKRPSRRANRSAQALGTIEHPPLIFRHLDADRQIFRHNGKVLGFGWFLGFLKSKVRAWVARE